MTVKEELIKQIEETGKALQGRSEYLKYLRGEKLTQREAIKAFCYDCMGYYDDGAQDCMSDICPLRPFMPYVTVELKQKRHMSEEALDRLSRARGNKKKNDAESL